MIDAPSQEFATGNQEQRQNLDHESEEKRTECAQGEVPKNIVHDLTILRTSLEGDVLEVLNQNGTPTLSSLNDRRKQQVDRYHVEMIGAQMNRTFRVTRSTWSGDEYTTRVTLEAYQQIKKSLDYLKEGKGTCNMRERNPKAGKRKKCNMSWEVSVQGNSVMMKFRGGHVCERGNRYL